MDAAAVGAGKRRHDPEFGDRNGRTKRRDRPGSDRYQESNRGRVFMDDVVFRLLCPGQKVGSVIGKGGSIIKALRNETGAIIKVEDAPPGAPERVVIIAASGKDADRGRLNVSQANSEKGLNESEHDKEGVVSEKYQEHEEASLPPVMQALLKVYARIVEGDDVFPNADDVNAEPQSVTMKFLVPNNQIGCLLGKGGKIIQQMRLDTGAEIRILPKEQLPNCALPSDEIVQVIGDMDIVKKALHAIGFRLYENPPKERAQPGAMNAHMPSLIPAPGSFLPSDSGSHMMALPPPPPSFGNLGAIAYAGAGWPYGSAGGPDFAPLSLPHDLHGGDSPEAELVIRILCPNDKIGGIIGKGGNVIQSIREESHAGIKIADSVPNSDERVISISSIEVFGDPYSPTVEAALQVQSRIAELAEKDGTAMFTRLLVPSVNIGCLLGKGGNIISEMRKLTRASIRILPKENLPPCALKTDELLQIAGDTNISRDALIEVVSRLRTNLFKGHIGAGGNDVVLPVDVGHQGNFPLRPAYNGRGEARSPPAMHHLPGTGYQSSDHSSFGPPAGPWPFQGASGFGGPPFSGFGGEISQPASAQDRSGRLAANLSGTTIEITIPQSAVGSIIGKGGNNIVQIRQISGAKIKLHEERPGKLDRIVEISGTPEQTQAAQSLLEAFIITSQSPGGIP